MTTLCSHPQVQGVTAEAQHTEAKRPCSADDCTAQGFHTGALQMKPLTQLKAPHNSQFVFVSVAVRSNTHAAGCVQNTHTHTSHTPITQTPASDSGRCWVLPFCSPQPACPTSGQHPNCQLLWPGCCNVRSATTRSESDMLSLADGAGGARWWRADDDDEEEGTTGSWLKLRLRAPKPSIGEPTGSPEAIDSRRTGAAAAAVTASTCWHCVCACWWWLEDASKHCELSTSTPPAWPLCCTSACCRDLAPCAASMLALAATSGDSATELLRRCRMEASAARRPANNGPH